MEGGVQLQVRLHSYILFITLKISSLALQVGVRNEQGKRRSDDGTSSNQIIRIFNATMQEKNLFQNKNEEGRMFSLRPYRHQRPRRPAVQIG
jgi:hypothetical protein